LAPKSCPELAKGLGQGIKEFKRATDNASAGMREAVEETLPGGIPSFASHYC